MSDPSKITIRMLRGADNTLDGYIFTDRSHAHRWLSQPFVDREKIQLEEVQVGPRVGCDHCRGTGWFQNVKVLRKLTKDEVKNV